ncbi:hypothetical protein IPM65_05780 [Candidatus Roizmanbacteria bacterium]|nr:MAG: hypothetical protein IPM65_05780 [Candidatus Roizmanbacteria bacterium]
MLTIIAGEDTIRSREKLQELKEQYKQKGYSIDLVAIADIPDLLKNADGVTNLFGQESVYITENASSKYKGRAKTPYKDAVQQIAKSSVIHLIDWEEGKSSYDLATIKKIATTFYEAKPEKTIFELLDACYPGNLEDFLRSLEIVNASQDMGFIYALLCRHVRKLYLASEGIIDTKTPPWQRGRISFQAKKWDTQKLMKFYEGLARIDTSMKTNTTPYDLKKSVELLVCYYLK